MPWLVTDRTQANVNRRNELSSKGWNRMTVAERDEWRGDPMTREGTNLIPYGPYYSSGVDITHTHDAITATATTSGVYLHSILPLGNAVDFDNKEFILSIESIEAPDMITPQIIVYWHDGIALDYVTDHVATITTPGKIVVDTISKPNVNNRASLALYIYITTDASTMPGVTVRFKNVMLENGTVKHDYVPYTEIVPTNCTKGAYNYSDLNRVERACKEISDANNLSLVTKTDWTMWDIPTVSDMGRLLYNIGAIRDIFQISTPIPDTMNNLNYADANNIEMILEEALAK